MDQFASELEQTLGQVLNPSNPGAIRQTTETLRTGFYKAPESVPTLIHILQSHPEPQMRQLAGVEVRKLIPRHWEGLSNAPELRQSLLTSTTAEQNDLVRHTSSRVISMIASVDMERNAWPELLPTLVQTAQASKSTDREVAVYILFTLFEQGSIDEETHLAQLMQLLATTISDPESLQVRVSSVLALGKIAELTSNRDVVSQFEQVIPPMVDVLRATVASGDEKGASQVFEVFTDLVLDDPALLGNSFADLLQLMVSEFAVPESVDIEHRNAALQVVYNMVRFRHKKIMALKYGPTITKACLHILSNADDDEDDDEDDDDIAPSHLSLRILELLASDLPPAQVLAPLFEVLPQLFSSGDPKQARAGFLALSVMVEGAPDFVSGEFDTIMNYVVGGLQSNTSAVQVAALQALGMLSLELSDQVGALHETLLPLVFGIMDGATSLKIGRAACIALDAIIEVIDGEVITEKYLSALAPKLLDLIDNTNDTDLKSRVVGALSSAAFTSGRNFLPYFERTIHTISKFIVVPKPGEQLDADVLKLCGTTLDALGTMCAAVGKQNFAPYLNSAMDAVGVYLSSDISELRDPSFVFISVVVKVYRGEVSRYMDGVLKAIFDTFDQLEFEETDGDDMAIGAEDAEDALDNFKINGAVAMEKELACDCLAEIAHNMPPADFAPHVPRTLDALEELSEHFYEEIRRSTLLAMWRMFIAYYVGDNGSKTWSPGYPFQGQLTPVTGTILKRIQKITNLMFGVEDECKVMLTAFQCLTDAIRTCGPVVLGDQENLEVLMTAVYEVLGKTHQCLQDGFDEEGGEHADGPEELTELEEAVAETAMDVTVQVASAMGPQFIPIFPSVASILAKYITSKSASERALGIGTMAELVEVLKDNVTEYTGQLLEVFVAGLDDKKLAVRSVGAFGVGMLCFHSGQTDLTKSSYPTILPKLQGLLKKVDKEEKRREKSAGGEEETYNDQRSLANACGCVARMVLKHPDAVPLDQVVSVLLERLPLKDAFEENSPIFNLILQLAQQQHPVVASHIQDILRLLVASFTEQQVVDQRLAGRSVGNGSDVGPLSDPATRANAIELAKFLEQTQPGVASSHQVLAAVLH
ncbi:Importin subunit beta-4 [Wickerhamiella sorbophila]|uniref:Importin subunit beta-4 n=1 Tax=Wickerhamiella sorbophila TaxID=45607 RepID=A0A2T0FGK1_9ASCO|nr:Importin subunit beta-4 [Wickerhamiella sorbophila]PRT54110.1 Importin subunit beta-4 [Wickerhamiella sorbophila]